MVRPEKKFHLHLESHSLDFIEKVFLDLGATGGPRVFNIVPIAAEYWGNARFGYVKKKAKMLLAAHIVDDFSKPFRSDKTTGDISFLFCRSQCSLLCLFSLPLLIFDTISEMAL